MQSSVQREGRVGIFGAVNVRMQGRKGGLSPDHRPHRQLLACNDSIRPRLRLEFFCTDRSSSSISYRLPVVPHLPNASGTTVRAGLDGLKGLPCRFRFSCSVRTVPGTTFVVTTFEKEREQELSLLVGD